MPALPADLHALRKAYQTLGVPVEASAHAIKQEYRRRAKQWHPDRWPAGTDAQERAAAQMRELNDAYALVRHAPLRYHIKSHPRVEARAERRGTPVKRQSVPLTDHGEYVARFVLGALVGVIPALWLFWSGTTESLPILIGIPIGSGLLSVILGDQFWHALLDGLWWWF
jgi:hypothetical protein